MEFDSIFWLHVKKAGGTSLRDVLSPFYVLADDRYTYPKPFIASPREQWNDILNNYRIPLGKYDYKRMLFAKKHLYTEEEFCRLYKFVVVRNPYDRAVSAWKYIGRNNFLDLRFQKMKRSFSYFLDSLPDFMDQRFQQIYHNAYVGQHLAPVWPDITDDYSNLLVNKIVKLEKFNEDIEELNSLFGLNIQLTIRKNSSSREKAYQKYFTNKTRAKVESIFSMDIENLKYNF